MTSNTDSLTLDDPKKILLVEDDPDIREMVAAMLAPSHCEITEVDNIDVALRALTTARSIDFAILDFWLGEKYFVELIEALRTGMREVPVIKISGGNDSLGLEKTEAISDVSGAVMFLKKPFLKADLVAAVTIAIK